MRIIPSMSPNINAARLLLEYYGYDSLSYFALNEKKKYFFSSTGKAFLSYIILHRVALVSGDPIGPVTDTEVLLKEFTYFVRGAKLSMCFVGIHQNSIPILQSFNHKIIHAGDEAIVNLSEYKKENLKKRVRRAERHIDTLGITGKVYTRKKLPKKYLQQINIISEEWIMEKGGHERGFSMTLGRVPNVVDTKCEFVVALQNDTVLGYLTFVPILASRSLSLDASRRKHEAPNGLTEFLLMKAFQHYKLKKKKQISLNFAAFYKHDNKNTYSIKKLVKRGIFKSLRNFYKTNKLYAFKEKFLPQWESRYLSFEKKRHIPRYLVAIARTELNM